MYGYEFLKPGEPKDVVDEIAKDLLKQNGVEECVSKQQVDELTRENAELKKQLAAQTNQLDIEALKREAEELGVSFRPNIKAEKLLAKINEAKESK